MSQTAPETLPAHYYRDPELYEAERRTIFARTWLLIAHESQIETPNAYLATNAAGFPIIVVRDKEGEIRAFHNVCRHRAGPLADDGQGHCEGFLVCRYHGWRYALDGRLASARDFGPAEDFDVRDYGLKPVKCQRWRGFIFINMDLNAAPLENAIAPLIKRTAHLPMESFRFARQTTHDIRCNWKTYVENYLEGYHIPLVHPFLNSAVDASKYEVDVSAPVIFHQAPPRDGSPADGLWAWMWPCLGVNLYGHGVLMERMWPVSPTQTRLDYLCFFPEGTERTVIERSMAASEITTDEDRRICEQVQRNLDAGIYETGRLSPKHEQGVAWFQKELRSALSL